MKRAKLINCSPINRSLKDTYLKHFALCFALLICLVVFALGGCSTDLVEPKPIELADNLESTGEKLLELITDVDKDQILSDDIQTENIDARSDSSLVDNDASSKEHELASYIEPDGVWELKEVEQGEISTTWIYRSDQSINEVVEYIESHFSQSGLSVVDSGYLDMGGNAWGCVCEIADLSGSVVISVLGQTTYLQDDSQSADSYLDIRIVLYEASNFELG